MCVCVCVSVNYGIVDKVNSTWLCQFLTEMIIEHDLMITKVKDYISTLS